MVNNKTKTARLEVCLNAFFFKKRPKSKQTKEEHAKKISGIKKILKILLSIGYFIVCYN